MDELVEVTQEDRDAAWRYAEFHCLPDSQMRERWFAGYYDTTEQGRPIRAFARHRIAAIEAARPAVMAPVNEALAKVEETASPSAWEVAIDDLLEAIRQAGRV